MIQDEMGSSLYQFTLPVESIAEPQASDGTNSIMAISVIASIVIGIAIFLIVKRHR